MNNKIYIGRSEIKKAGRGVFASKSIRKNEVIEICPVIFIKTPEEKHIQKTILQHYIFEHKPDSALLALGFGSLYNHKDIPNARYELLEEETEDGCEGKLYIMASKTIRKDEEICINYGPFFDEKYKTADA